MNPINIAVFRADITPHIGDPLSHARGGVVETIETPLLAKGILLRDAQGRVVVLCAVDECGIWNNAYDQLRDRLAEAANTTRKHIAVQTVHQHTANTLNPAAERMATAAGLKPTLPGQARLDFIANRLTDAISDASNSWQPLTGVGAGWSVIDRLASNRRVHLPDGRILPRFSSATDRELQQAPEGLIDGYLRTVSFRSNNQTVAQLHYYASHPQSSYGKGQVSYDVPGMARETIERETGVPQLYFTGCAGQIAFGKYNDGEKQTQTALVQNLQNAMNLAIANTDWREPGTLDWRVAPVRFEARGSGNFAREHCRAVLDDQNAEAALRIRAAFVLSWHERVGRGSPVELSALALGGVRILHLPGEPFVQYQLYAQQHCPADFVCVAGYGDCGMAYLPTDNAYHEDGAYEQTWALAEPCESLLKNAIAELL